MRLHTYTLCTQHIAYMRKLHGASSRYAGVHFTRSPSRERLKRVTEVMAEALVLYGRTAARPVPGEMRRIKIYKFERCANALKLYHKYSPMLMLLLFGLCCCCWHQAHAHQSSERMCACMHACKICKYVCTNTCACVFMYFVWCYGVLCTDICIVKCWAF